MRKAREGIEQGDSYPEWAWVTAHPVARFWWRLLTGRPMDGRRWTDSTFWRSATRGEDQWWLRLAGWQRAAARLAGMHTLLLLLPACFLLHVLGGDGAISMLLAAHAALALVFWAPVALYRAIRDHGLTVPWVESVTTAELEKERRLTRRTVVAGRKRWLNEKILPVAKVASVKLNRRYHPKEAQQWVSVPRDYRETGGAPVEVLLPQSFVLNEAARRSLARAVEERLGLKDAQYRYELEGNAPRLLLTAPILPPDFVSFSDMRPALTAAKEFSFVVGMSGKEAFSVNLQDDSPHLALSAGSGAGKSVLIRQLVAQALHWGWSVLILDWKEESQEWADGLPGVRYVRSIDKLHDACLQLGEEIEDRKSDTLRRGQHSKILVVSEEWGITAPLLAEYWTELRSTAEPEERRLMPLKSPAAVAMMKLNFTGRSLGLCQLLVAQRFSARVTNGNADLRESFTTIFMSRWKAQTFKMLAPDIRPIPRKITTPGGWLAVTGDEAVRFQAGYWTEDEAREWATSGITPPLSPWSERYNVVNGQADRQLTSNVVNDTDDLQELLPIEAAAGSDTTSHMTTVRLRRLADLADDLEHLAVTHKILRNWRDNEAEFPQPRGGTPSGGWLYDQAEVIEYARRRRASEAVKQSQSQRTR